MPGHILHAECACGFWRELTPGSSISNLYVIAYTADGEDLVTIESGEAERATLTALEDPWLKAQNDDPLSPSFEASWGPYRCPRCGRERLQLSPWGFW